MLLLRFLLIFGLSPIAVLQWIALLVLLLVFCLLVLAVSEQILSDLCRIFERLRCINASDEHLLLCSEANTNRTNRTKLVVQIQSVSQFKLVHIDLLDTKEIFGSEFAVSCNEVAFESGKLVLDETLDTRIFNNIQVERSSLPYIIAAIGCAAHCINGDLPTIAWRMQSMRDLVPDEHIVNSLAHVLPLRKNQSTVLEVERGSRRGCVNDDADVLR